MRLYVLRQTRTTETACVVGKRAMASAGQRWRGVDWASAHRIAYVVAAIERRAWAIAMAMGNWSSELGWSGMGGVAVVRRCHLEEER